MDTPEGFETTTYGDQEDSTKVYSVICQIMEDRVRESPTFGMKASISNGLLKIFYHCYEMHLPSRVADVQDRAQTAFREVLKHIKKEYRSRTKESIDLKEKKELANHTVQKVSMNERYYAVFWKFYELS